MSHKDVVVSNVYKHNNLVGDNGTSLYTTSLSKYSLF